MLSDSIIDQRRMTQARIDALFAGKISTDAFLRTKRSDESNIASDVKEAMRSNCLKQFQGGNPFP